MEFKEIKVGTLSKEEKALLEHLVSLRAEGERLLAEHQNKLVLFWDALRENHHLSYSGNHHIKGNTIYQRILE